MAEEDQDLILLASMAVLDAPHEVAEHRDGDSFHSEREALEPQTSFEHSTDDLTTIAKGTHARRVVQNLDTASFSLLVGLLPVYFLVFAGLAYSHNGVSVTNSVSRWILEARIYVSTSQCHHET